VACHIYDDSFTAAIKSRFCNSSLDKPATRITVVRLLEPETIVMEAQGQRQNLRQKLDAGVVGLPPYRRRSQCYLERVPNFASNGILLRTGMESDLK